MAKYSGFRKNIAYHFAYPVVQLLARTSITPNLITWSGFLLALGASALVITEHLFIAGLVVLVSGFFDMLDGALARSTNKATPFGAILDSTLDRLGEAALLLGLLVLYAREQSVLGIILVGAALLGSFMVSYIRARAEALGLKGETGLFTRAERVIVLALGLLLSQFDIALIISLGIIIVFSFFTVGQRLASVWRQTGSS